MAQTNIKIKNPLVNFLLEKNHYEHHIFYSPKDFHNHFPHSLLSSYALGANDERLKKEAEIEGKYLEKIGDRVPTKITEENWRDFLGDKCYYPNYLDFFDDEISKKGSLSTMVKYAFDRAYFPRLVAGFLHPIIHLGFGIAFENDLITSEGLAEGAIHPNETSTLLDLEGPLNPDQQLGESKTPMEIIELIHNDKSLDSIMDVFHRTDYPELPHSTDRIKEFARLWCIRHNEESVQKAIEHLYTAAVCLYSTTGFHPTDPSSSTIKLDFFLMHILTSVLSVQTLLPYLPIPLAVLLLKSHFAAAIWLYLSRGRPRLDLERLQTLEFSSDFNEQTKTWEDLIKFGPLSDDMHHAKVIRALWIAHQLFEEKNESRESLLFKSAMLTIDQMVNKKREWTFDLLDAHSWGSKEKV